MKIAKIVPFSYEIVYIDDEGKYSVYKRTSDGEWSDALSGKKADTKKSTELESAYKKETKPYGK